MDGVQGVDGAEAPLVPSDMRVSDQDRDSAVEQLSEHAAAGRLTLDELEERVSVALAARTRGEMGALTRDLPGNAGRPAATPPYGAPRHTALPDRRDLAHPWYGS